MVFEDINIMYIITFLKTIDRNVCFIKGVLHKKKEVKEVFLSAVEPGSPESESTTFWHLIKSLI